MKLVVQIPCLNEEQTLPLVLQSIPKQIDGIDSIDVLIIDDGSTDRTIEVAKEHGVKHFVRHAANMGLARSFNDGINYALSIGADIVVNTDGDNQYPQEKIADLVQPILRGEAEIVIADRQTDKIAHFSPMKKFFQRLGSNLVNIAAGTNLPDAPSGFRAYSKYSLLRLNTTTKFSYTMETIIQAGNKNLAITSIPVTTNPKLRESRLFNNIWQHMYKSSMAIIRSYIMYRPYLIFAFTGLLFFALGLIPFIRFMYFFFIGQSDGHIQSLVVGGTLMTAAFISFALAIITDLIRINRAMLEDALERIKTIQYGK